MVSNKNPQRRRNRKAENKPKGALRSAVKERPNPYLLNIESHPINMSSSGGSVCTQSQSQRLPTHPLTQLAIAVNAIISDEAPHFEARTIPVTAMPVGAIGWTQDSISRSIYNVTAHDTVPIRDVVRRALNDPRGALTFMREHFPDPIRVFDSGENGTLSLDNRRLTVYRMVVSSDTAIPVRVITREQADREIRATQPRRLRDSSRGGLIRRYTTRNGGYSIEVRDQAEPGGPRTVVSQGECYVESPFVVSRSPTCGPKLITVNNFFT